MALYARYENTATDKLGNGLGGASVTVYTQPGSGQVYTGLATIYSDATGTALANPIVVDSYGNYHFYAAAGIYTVVVTYAGVSFVEADIPIFSYETVIPSIVTGSVTSSAVNRVQYITDTTTDLGTQVNNAITALGATGGTIRIAQGAYTFAVQIVADSKVNITIEGDGGLTAGASGASKITWTGTTIPISAKSTVGFRLRNLQILWNNASFNGTVVDLTGSSGDSAAFEIAYNSFYKTGSGVAPAVLISTDKANSGTIHDNVFGNYQVAIRGLSVGTNYSNRVSVIGNSFSSSTGTAQTAHIQNPGQAWYVASNTFEMGNGAGNPKVIDCAVINTGQGLSFVCNWIGDDNIAVAHTFINAASPLYASGNYLSGNANATIFAVPASGYVHADSNDFVTALVAYDVTAGNGRLDTAGNIYNSITTVVNGIPIAGVVEDSSALIVKTYGTSFVQSLNGVVYADQQAGADIGAKITAAIAALPSTGGVVDARNFTGDQSCSSTITLGSTTKPVTLLLGNYRLLNSASPAIIVPGASWIIGQNYQGGAGLSCVHSTANGGNAILWTGSYGGIRNLFLGVSPSGTGQIALYLQASGTTSVQFNEFINIQSSGPGVGVASSQGVRLEAATATALVTHNKFENIFIHDYLTDFNLVTSSTVGPTDNTFLNLTAQTFGSTAGTGISIVAGALNNFHGGIASSQATGINIASGASFNQFVGFRCESNTANIADAGTGSMFIAQSVDANTISGTDTTRTYLGVGNVATTQAIAGPLSMASQTIGIGNGAGTNLTSPAKGTGSGPASLVAVQWQQVSVNGSTYWIPLYQ